MVMMVVILVTKLVGFPLHYWRIVSIVGSQSGRGNTREQPKREKKNNNAIMVFGKLSGNLKRKV